MAPWEKLMIGEWQSHFNICFCLKNSLFLDHHQVSLLLKLMLNLLKWRDERAHFYLSCCKINALWASRDCCSLWYILNTIPPQKHIFCCRQCAQLRALLLFIQPSLLGSRLGTTFSIALPERKSIEANVPQCPSEGASIWSGAQAACALIGGEWPTIILAAAARPVRLMETLALELGALDEIKSPFCIINVAFNMHKGRIFSFRLRLFSVHGYFRVYFY